MSVSSEVQRTLVKSPPELWAELSDPASLASHLGELGEIRIIRTVPETTVEWEAPEVTGCVQIKPSAWGTRVTLSVTREQAQLGPEPQLIASGVSAPTVHPDVEIPPQASPARAAAALAGPEADPVSAEPAEVELSPGSESESPAVGVEPAPAPESENLGQSGQGPKPEAEPTDPSPPSVGAAADEDAGSAASEAERHSEGVATSGDPPESQPTLAPRRRLFGRAWRRLRRLRPVTPAPPAVVGSAEDPLPEPSAVAGAEPSAAVAPSQSGEVRAGPQPSAALSVEPSPTVPPSESVQEQTAPEPIAVAAGEPCAARATGWACGQSDGSKDAELERPAERRANSSLDPGELERRTAEEMTAVLLSMLDRLGAAHHRPFSRG